MLNSDLCLAYDNNGAPGTLKSGDKLCCSWTETEKLFYDGTLLAGRPNQFCGVNISYVGENDRALCCRPDVPNCDEAKYP